jgi:hypothetical protein
MGNVTGGTKIPCRVRRTLDVGDFIHPAPAYLVQHGHPQRCRVRQGHLVLGAVRGHARGREAVKKPHRPVARYKMFENLFPHPPK